MVTLKLGSQTGGPEGQIKPAETLYQAHDRPVRLTKQLQSSITLTVDYEMHSIMILFVSIIIIWFFTWFVVETPALKDRSYKLNKKLYF